MLNETLNIERIQSSADQLFEEGIKRLNKKNYSGAEKYFTEIIASDRGNAKVHFYMAYSLQNQKKLEAALFHYKKVLDYDLYYPDVYTNLGALLKDQGKFKESLSCLAIAEKLQPEDSNVYNNIGLVSFLTGEFEEAEKRFVRAIELNSSYREAKLNLANLYTGKNDYFRAYKLIQEILKFNPDDVSTHFNKSLLLLKNGNFLEGFKEYEWRMRFEEYPEKKYSIPKLDSLNVEGKKLLLYDEQGFGDTIQFGRFAKLLKEKGADVYLECHSGLKRLMNNCDGIDQAFERNEEPKFDFDYYYPLLSLPFLFNLRYDDLADEKPYININDKIVNEFRNKIGFSEEFKIGIIWKGKKPVGNAHRSMSLETFVRLKELYGISCFSLQKDPYEKEKQFLNGMGIKDLSQYLNDFLDTAAAMKNMDFIISIDTSTAHLAGAIGVDTAILLSKQSDWRWFKDIEFSPWYPTAKIYRQEIFNEWDKVLEKVIFDINRKIN